MKYDLKATIDHPVSVANKDCITSFNDLILKEDYSLTTPPSCFDSSIQVLDLDKVANNAAVLANTRRASTVDCVFAISSVVDAKIILVELKLNYINPNNLSRDELIGKVSGSTNILGATLSIFERHIIIFKQKLYQQARHRLQRMNPKVPNNYEIMTIEELKNTFF